MTLELEDTVSAHLCALHGAEALGFGRYIVSATTPLQRDDAAELRRDAPAVVRRRVPGWESAYAALGWTMTPTIDRVYDNARARADLRWSPRHDFGSTVAVALARAGDIRSDLARVIGAKGYHGR